MGFGKGQIGGLDGRPEEMGGPIHEIGQQEDFHRENGGGRQNRDRLHQAGTGAETRLRRNEFLENQADAAQVDLVVVGQSDGTGDRIAVAPHGMIRRQRGQVDARAAFLQAGVTGRHAFVAIQHQMASGIASGHRQGLAHHNALAFMAAGLKDQSVHAGGQSAGCRGAMAMPNSIPPSNPVACRPGGG